MIPPELDKAITEMIESSKAKDYREKLASIGISDELVKKVAERHGIDEIHASQVIMRAVRRQLLT